MAKQSGIHQLRGKVGEHSYYRQTGVPTGLVRSINQGLSARVKSGEEYVNTRLNNAEFGQAGAIASMVAKLINPKYRPMMLPFSQSKMARLILSEIKTEQASWGQRNLTLDNASQTLASALESVRKNDPSNYGIRVEFDEDSDTWVARFDAEVWKNYMAGIGADGAILNMIAARPFIGKYGNRIGAHPYFPCIPNFNSSTTEISSTPTEEGFPIPPAGPTQAQSAFAFGSHIGIAVVMPFRTINNVQHILQEYCTYALTSSITE